MFQSHPLVGPSLPSFSELLTSIPLPSQGVSPVESESPASRKSSLPSLASLPSLPMPNGLTVVPFPSMVPKRTSSTSPYLNYKPTSANTAPHLNNYQYQLHYPYLHPVQPLPVHEPSQSTPSYGSRSGSACSSSSCSSPKTSSLDLEKDPSRKHICKLCTRSFTTSGHLARHNRIHTGERKHICPWPTCDARFARQDNCMQHYKTHTNGKNKRTKLGFKGKY